MKMKPKYKSDAFEAILSSASALFKIGAIDKTTMRDFDDSGLKVTPIIEATKIKKIREQNHVSLHSKAHAINPKFIPRFCNSLLINEP